ncbi:MAG: GspH/FimT family protein [Sulfuricella sp.]|jgi:general secretion pathway protein H|nr:GspH/FimT family protein [Sulfuricella sp.]
MTSAKIQRGFTLVELLVVMVVMLLAYGLVPPLFSSGVSGTEMKATARQLAAGLRKARSTAISTGRETALALDVEGRRFELSGDKRVYRLPGKVELTLFTAQSELSSDKTGAIRFYPDGSSTGGRITIAGGANRKYLVDVDWLTGRVVIRD